MRHRIDYVKKRKQVVELVAELIQQKHTCGPDCFCWQLRQVPSISDAIQKLHVQKLQVPTQPRD
jgi:hypothetical protein